MAAEIFNFFPSDIQTKIFSQLPFYSIIQCKRVCKTWRAGIHELRNDPSFIDTHKQRLLSLSSSSPPTDDAASSFTSFLVREKQSKPGKFHIVGSCNGLICFVDKNYNAYLCNPVTRECMNLPTPSPSPSPSESGKIIAIGFGKIIAIGFGYLLSTNEYKYVRIAFDPMRKIYASVYTLGSGTWSIKKIQGDDDMNHHLWYVTAATAAGFHSNGVIYWNTITSQPYSNILSFNLESKELRIVRIRNYEACMLGGIRNYEACMLGGRVCYITTHDREVREQEIWVVTDDSIWAKLIRIKPELEKDFTPPITLEEKILLSYDYMKFLSYDPETSSPSQMVDSVEILVPYMSKFEMIPYTMSLISIRALGVRECLCCC